MIRPNDVDNDDNDDDNDDYDDVINTNCVFSSHLMVRDSSLTLPQDILLYANFDVFYALRGGFSLVFFVCFFSM